jgi:hypothetical protein
MAINGISTSPGGSGKAVMTITAIPNSPVAPPPSVTGASVVIGSSIGAYGVPQPCSVSQDPTTGDATCTVTLDTTGVSGDTVFFVATVAWNDGTTDKTPDSAFPNVPVISGPATGLQAVVQNQQIPLGGGSAVITARAVAVGSPADGRTVTFQWKTGTAHGTLSPAGPQTLDSNGEAQVTFVPSQAGEAQIEAAVDGLTARAKVLVKN